MDTIVISVTLPIGDWNVKITGISVDPRMYTSQPGIFGAGDFITYGSKVRLIAGAFNDAVLAVNSAKLYLEPSASDMAGVSFHNARFFVKNKAISTL